MTSYRATAPVRFGGFAFDRGTRQLTLDGAPVHLTPKAFDLLSVLIAEAPRVPLHEGENLIGRDAACTVRVDLQNISRTHARIVVTGHDATIEDLGSTNGTLIGDKRVVGPTALRDRDRILVGDATLTFHVSAVSLPKETLPVTVEHAPPEPNDDTGR